MADEIPRLFFVIKLFELLEESLQPYYLFFFFQGGSDQVLPGQARPLDQPLAHVAVPLLHHPAQVPAAGQKPQQRANE